VKAFAYQKPKTLDEALALGQAPHSRFLAGGTLLVDLLRLDVERPENVVDLSAALTSTIVRDAGGLMLGALASNTDVAYHPDVAREFPALAAALLSGASPQLRNQATVGGNLLQRTRCAYFRDAAVPACNKRAPGSGCAALQGYSRMHAVLGTSAHCIATHPSDLCVALLALDAEVLTRRAAGPRRIPFGAFHALPGARPDVETALEPGEIVTHVFVPAGPRARRSAYVKVRDRASFAFALASAAVALELDGAVIRSARVALGGVATKPWRALETEAALSGQKPGGDVLHAAARLALREARTTHDNAFKVALAERVIVRALERAGGMA
jgi:xanthine dehydrogenase YagS FAD-binding subunit